MPEDMLEDLADHLLILDEGYHTHFSLELEWRQLSIIAMVASAIKVYGLCQYLFSENQVEVTSAPNRILLAVLEGGTYISPACCTQTDGVGSILHPTGIHVQGAFYFFRSLTRLPSMPRTTRPIKAAVRE